VLHSSIYPSTTLIPKEPKNISAIKNRILGGVHSGSVNTFKKSLYHLMHGTASGVLCQCEQLVYASSGQASP
jgi:hypothetical protein